MLRNYYVWTLLLTICSRDVRKQMAPGIVSGLGQIARSATWAAPECSKKHNNINNIGMVATSFCTCVWHFSYMLCGIQLIRVPSNINFYVRSEMEQKELGETKLNRYNHYQKHILYWVLRGLPSVITRPLGKKHSANNLFAESQTLGIQRHSVMNSLSSVQRSV
jgi:hypothetical protein